MSTYICLLRGINVSGKNRLPMADLRSLLTDCGATQVRTYIQSGNAIFQHEQSAMETVKARIAMALKQRLGNPVAVFLYHPEAFQQRAKWPGELPESGTYFCFLEQIPETTLARSLEAEEYAHESIVIRGDMAYLHCRKGLGKARLDNSVLERKLQLKSTMRNARTVDKLLALLEGD